MDTGHSIPPTPIYSIQHSRFATQDGWQLKDIHLCSFGYIAVSGGHYDGRSFACVHSIVDTSDNKDKSTLLYNKEFVKYSGYRRYISLMKPNSTEILTCLYDNVDVIDYTHDLVLRSRKVNGRTTCLTVNEGRVFIGFLESDIVNSYDENLNRIKSIKLKGIRRDDFPRDIAAAEDRLYVCTQYGRAIVYSQNSILTEYTTGRDYSRPCSLTVTAQLGVVAVLWDNQVAVYSFNNHNCLVVFDFENGVSRIRISDQGRIVTGNEDTGEVKIYNVAQLYNYGHMKENLASQLRSDDCVRLTSFFALPKDQADAIIKSDTPTKNLLLALEEKGFIQPSDIDRLFEAFIELKVSSSCFSVADVYQKTRMQATLYGRFLAALSAHLTTSLPVDLCVYFNIPDEKKSTIMSSQNPGLSFLLALDERKVIKPSDVGALEQPFGGFGLVQARAKVEEYQTQIKEETLQSQLIFNLTIEEKVDIFVQCLRRKIKSWYESMSPVPWKKSCKWSSSDLFVGSGLILTYSKAKPDQTDIDPKCKLQYHDLLIHDRLKSENRLILEGEPGCGKTMLSSQLAYDWCQGKLQDTDILVFLPLKFVEGRKLVKAIRKFYMSDKVPLTEEDIEAILHRADLSTVMLLDGLEEYNGPVTKAEGKQSEVHEVMSKAKYPGCKVVLTSRSDYAQNLPACPMLRLGRFGEEERNVYIEKAFADDKKKQQEIKRVIEDTPLILDLCSIPLLFVLAVHNTKSMVKLQKGQLDRVSPFMYGMAKTFCPPFYYEESSDTPELEKFKHRGLSIEEIAFNGLCNGFQQLSWPKDFMEQNIDNIKAWIDSGVLVVEDGIAVVKNDEVGIESQLKKESVETAKAAAKTEKVIVPSTSVLFDEQGAASQKKLSDSESHRKRKADKDSQSRFDRETTDSENQSRLSASGLTSQIVPLRLKFLHKVFQEWFAAKFLTSVIWFQNKNTFSEQLTLIDPADLHYVLRFTCNLCPPSCHIVLNHLLKSYRSNGGILPMYILDCICLCYAEYDGYMGDDIKIAVSEICKETITIQPTDSRLLQQSKVAMLKFASQSGIPILKVQLLDVVTAVGDELLTLNTGVAMDKLDTLHVIEVSRWDHKLNEKDYSNLLNFIAVSKSVKHAYLIFPSQPPKLQPVTLQEIASKQVTVDWHIGQLVQTLDPSKGIWMMHMKRHHVSKASEVSPMQLNPVTEGRNRGQASTSLYKEQYVDEDGGTLILPEANISLHVPPGALSYGCIMSITVPMYARNCSLDMEFVPRLTPLVICEPDGLTFNEPVELILPHCAAITETKNHKVTVSFGKKEKHSTNDMEWESEPVGYLLTTKYCHIFLQHFSGVDVNITNTEEKILRVIPFSECVNNKRDLILTVWLCNDLESDLQSVLQDEKENRCIPLDSYDTFKLRHDENLRSSHVEIRIEPLGASEWHPKDTKETIDVNRLCTASKSKCNFRLQNVGQNEDSCIYLALRITQHLDEEQRETAFIIKRKVSDLQMSVYGVKSHLLKANQECNLLPSGRPPSEVPKTCTAVLYMDSLANCNEDVILTQWLCSHDSTSTMFQSLRKEQEFFSRHKVDTENSITIFDDRKYIVTRTQFQDERWSLVPEQKVVETDRVRVGSRAKSQFIAQNSAKSRCDYIDLEVNTFQEGLKGITFMKKVEVARLLQTNTATEACQPVALDDTFGQESKDADKPRKAATECFEALCHTLEENLSADNCKQLGNYFNIAPELLEETVEKRNPSSLLLSLIRERRIFEMRNLGPLQNGLHWISRHKLAREVAEFKKSSSFLLESFGVLQFDISEELSLSSSLKIATIYELSSELRKDIEHNVTPGLRLMHVLVEKGLVSETYTSSLRAVLLRIGNHKAAQFIDRYNQFSM